MAVYRLGNQTGKKKVNRFLFKSFHIRRLQKQLFILPYKSLYFDCYATVLMVIFRAWATCVKTRTHAIKLNLTFLDFLYFETFKFPARFSNFLSDMTLPFSLTGDEEYE